MRRLALPAVSFVVLAIAAQVALADVARYAIGPASRDGIAKRYHGREIAQVMGASGASWLERPEREKEERTDLLVELLELSPGMAVAEVGAGTGYLARPIAARLGAEGRVFAVDVQPAMLAELALVTRRFP